MNKENWINKLRHLTTLCYETWDEDDADVIATILDVAKDEALDR